MALLLRPASLVWLVLMLATCITTWWLPKGTAATAATTVLILLIAAIKIRLVLMHFMELRHAPIRWRLLFEAWVVVVTIVLVSLYLTSPPMG